MYFKYGTNGGSLGVDVYSRKAGWLLSPPETLAKLTPTFLGYVHHFIYIRFMRLNFNGATLSNSITL
jgi:hypothetical protein